MAKQGLTGAMAKGLDQIDPIHFFGFNLGKKLVIGNFEVASEQYLMHTDPSNKVLATTTFPVADGPHLLNGEVDMPVIWTKRYGQGRVFYNSLGHQADIVAMPETRELMRRGMLWASDGKAETQ